MRDPQTAMEWQDAVNAAARWLRVELAVQIGLVALRDVAIDGARCREILDRGRGRGVVPLAVDLDPWRR